MKNKKAKQADITILHPRENQRFFGHEEAVQTLFSSFTNGNLPGAWLISGPRGIGKATMAYRFARFMLHNGSAKPGGLFAAEAPSTDLSIPKTSPAFAKVSIGSHPDLLVLESGSENSDSASGDILVDEARKIGSFLHLTSSETPYRLVIIDSIDDMNSNAANSILKLLEEPPANAMFILISHAPGRLLPTIRSRCRQIRMRELPPTTALNVLQNIAPDISEDVGLGLIELASGSPGIAYDLHINKGIEIYGNIVAIISSLPKLDIVAVQKLGESVSGKTNENYWRITKMLLNKVLIDATKNNAINKSIATSYSEKNYNNFKLTVAINTKRLLEIWKESNSLLVDADKLHLDRKAVLMKIFLLIAGK